MNESNIICPRCNLPSKRTTRGVCHNCYRKFIWVSQKVACKRCGRIRPIHAWGFCNGCYSSLFHIAKIKAHNRQKSYNISDELYKQLTSRCVICEFDKIIDLHHLDNNHSNNSPENLVGLCPNHHKMVHHRDLCSEVFNLLRQRGYKINEGYLPDNLLKTNLTATIHKNKLELNKESQKGV